MNKILVALCLLCLLSGCAAKDSQPLSDSTEQATPESQPLSEDLNQVNYERLPLHDYWVEIMDYSQEQIDQSFWQMLIDTPKTRYMAYRIWLTLGLNGNLTGDFNGIENAPIDKLIDQAIFSTNSIAYMYYNGEQGYQKNHIVALTYKKASEDGRALGDIFYADDIEQTLIQLYGEYPIAGESYKDHFTDGDYIEYYREEGLFLQRFDWGGARKKPLILNITETDDTIVCEFIEVDPWYFDGNLGYMVTYEEELTPENFITETAYLDVLRFTFRYAADDGRPVLHQVESLGKLKDYPYDFPANFVRGDIWPTADDLRHMENLISGVELPDIVVERAGGNFTLVLPGRWEEQYIVEPQGSALDLFDLYDAVNRKHYHTIAGHICSVMMRALAELPAERLEELTQSSGTEHIIGVRGEYAFICYVPEEGVYDTASQLLTQHYLTMRTDLKGILRTFMETNDITPHPSFENWDSSPRYIQ
jgi:hypothetical protein